MTRRPKLLAVLVLAALILAILSIWLAQWDLRSYGLLRRFIDPAATGPLLRSLTHRVTTQNVTIPLDTGGSFPARLYVPIGVAHPHGIVVVHGIHYLGIDEPRFAHFSHALAEVGFAVLNPQIASLADYHVDADSIETIGDSILWFDRRIARRRVAVAGISFGAGLSLLAACDPSYAPHIRSLALMGAYDSLSRVSRFLVTNQAEFPGGRSEPYAAYEYGTLVFIYAHLDQFFSPPDLPAAHEALKYWLQEMPDRAQPWLTRLSPAGRARMNQLFSHRADDLRPQILHAIQLDAPMLDAISPQGKLRNLRAPVFLLHGSADNIIPSTESLWLAQEVPRQSLGALLITPAFDHVDPDKKMALLDELRLVHFIARFLHSAHG